MKKKKKKKKKSNRSNKKYLRRYTNLAALRRLLCEQKLTLRNPQLWPDTNDTHYLESYRQKMELSSVLALCFTQSSERFHYWGAFGAETDPTEKVKIKFERSRLVEAIERQPSFKSREVEYRKMDTFKFRKLKKEELPFTKRHGFKPEREFRIICELKNEKLSEIPVDIPLSCISKITLSPWLSYSCFVALRNELRDIKDCSGLRIQRSTVLGNKKWKKYGDDAA